jgi:hypothetical protein
MPTHTIAFALPVLPGKTEPFRNAHARFAVDRRPEFEASRQRLGVLVERGFLQHTPMGDLAIVVLEVSDPARMLSGMASSPAPLDADFRAYLRDVFGIDAGRPPEGPPSELVFDWRARSEDEL